MANDVGRKVVDEYGNVFWLEETPLARGGQGIVFRTTEGDLAIKQPTDKFGEIISNSAEAERYRDLISRLRCLPLPSEVHIAAPRSSLRDVPGYVMKLLSDMVPFSYFNECADSNEIDEWSKQHPEVKLPEDEQTRGRFVRFLNSGSLRSRYRVLAKCAAELGRLHAAGIVYGDISPGNVFMKKDATEVWLIDPDNLRLETSKGAKAVYTPQYGAPELVQELHGGTPSSDIWAYAVMAFESLYLQHPFIGEAACSEEEAWDSDGNDLETGDGEDKAYRGLLPYIDDPEDDSNRSQGGFPREIFSTETLRKLFYRTFGPGRTDSFIRIAAPIWAMEFARHYDATVICPECGMTYDIANDNCPICDAPLPTHVRLQYLDRLLVFTKPKGVDIAEYEIPERFFSPFALITNDRPAYHVEIDFRKKTLAEVRLTERMPFMPDFTFFNLEE